jgi:hypothetical protein
MIGMKTLLRMIGVLSLTLTLTQPVFAVVLDVTYVGTWSSIGSGNQVGVGGPGLLVGQKYVIRVSYDDFSATTDNVPVLTSRFTDSGNDMRTINLTQAGNSLYIFVPMEGLDSGSPFIYTQIETDHLSFFTPAPTLNFINLSSISLTSNIIGLEFEGNFDSGAAFNVIELFNTSPGPAGTFINMVSQILNCGDVTCATSPGIASNDTNGLAVAVDLEIDAGPDIVYDFANLTQTTSSIVSQSNDLGAARSDNEDFIEALWSQSGTPAGTNLNDIAVFIADSGLTNTIDTASWGVTMTEQMTSQSDADGLNVSYANAGPVAEAGADIVFSAANALTGAATSGATVSDADLAVNAIIANFETLVFGTDADGNPLVGGTITGSTVANNVDQFITIADSGLTKTTSTSTFNLVVTDLAGASQADSAVISYLNATPNVSATATQSATGTDFTLFSDDQDQIVNAIIAGFEMLTVTALLDGNTDVTAFFTELINKGTQSSTTAILEAAFGAGPHTVSFTAVDSAGASAFSSVDFVVNSVSVEICALVTLNADMVSDFSDADAIVGDGCDVFDQSVPVGVAGMVDGTYRLKITNTGLESLTNVRINAPDFGLVDEPIPAACGDLDPGEMCTITFFDPGYLSLKTLDVCQAPGRVNKIASVDGDGAVSGIPVSDDDPASVDCVVEPNVTLRKEVSLNGGPFLDADTAATGPSGQLGADAEYRLIVENDGTETLVDALINDATLVLFDVQVPGGPLAPGDIRVITQGDLGFGPLLSLGRCDSVGTHMNSARVNATGELSGSQVSSEDPAYVNCEDPRTQLLKQVSLDGVNFFDADQPVDPDVPVGIVGLTDAIYRLIVTNTGSETLTNVLIEDATLGISSFIADLAPGETRVIESGDAGFGNLFQPMRCGGTPGNKSNIATADATGANSGTPVSDEDPANVRCIVGPEIQLLKQVSLDGVSFVDADTAATGPTGPLGADATYRLIARNVGDEDLTNVTIDDSTLGITAAVIPDLPIGAEIVIDVGSFGVFQELFFPNRCDSVGAKLNIAQVNATGQVTGVPVQDDNPAYVNCELPDDDNDGVPNGDDFCPGTVIPETVPTVRLGTNRWALIDNDLDFDTTHPKGKGPRRSYSTTDTAGCSCEQIIGALGFGSGHTKFGCSIGAMDDWVGLVNP